MRFSTVRYRTLQVPYSTVPVPVPVTHKVPYRTGICTVRVQKYIAPSAPVEHWKRIRSSRVSLRFALRIFAENALLDSLSRIEAFDW